MPAQREETGHQPTHESDLQDLRDRIDGLEVVITLLAVRSPERDRLIGVLENLSSLMNEYPRPKKTAAKSIDDINQYLKAAQEKVRRHG